ncbi:cytochrome P450 [Amniculicola lignicola CBS 123094]|uniref:Cytochrome P450 n=1 Tax=Amniculicola lignicola CBS 123094 TaxID=1392246 RepID=A0A6A5WQP5_9PLEO|nr:cytochrome P450 [Amniculicola lignicola CBS 123094]
MALISVDILVQGLWVALPMLILYPILVALYNITLHPLASFSGPIFWGASRLPYMYSTWTGWQHTDVQKLHSRYGSIVRIAPDELSFADPAAWDMYSNRGDSLAFPKSPVWHAPQPNRPISVLNVLDARLHAKMRKKMDGAFTEKAVGNQEGIVQGYVDLLIERLTGKAKSAGGEKVVINMIPWITFTAIDIIGDLAFGESFGCLERGVMSDWLDFVLNTLRAATLIATLRHYTWITAVLERLIPPGIMKIADDHYNVVVEKVDRRLKLETPRPDFTSEWQKDGKEKGDMLTKEEVYGNSFAISIAGSETVTTVLSGILNRVVKAPNTLALLTAEVRARFVAKDEITFAALKELPYLNAVIWEGFRTCNPVPVGLIRVTPMEGGNVCGYYIPRNTTVNLSILAMSFSPSLFHDPQSFHPERWLPEALNDPSSPFYTDIRTAVQPFSIGPRSCIGRPLALGELRLVLARLVWAFDIQEANTEAGKLVWERQRCFSVIERKAFEVQLKLRNP